MKPTYEFVSVSENHTIRKDVYPDFYHKLQRAILISLKDAGCLTHTQYRHAEEILNAHPLIRSSRGES